MRLYFFFLPRHASQPSFEAGRSDGEIGRSSSFLPYKSLSRQGLDHPCRDRLQVRSSAYAWMGNPSQTCVLFLPGAEHDPFHVGSRRPVASSITRSPTIGLAAFFQSARKVPCLFGIAPRSVPPRWKCRCPGFMPHHVRAARGGWRPGATAPAARPRPVPRAGKRRGGPPTRHTRRPPAPWPSRPA